MITEEQKKSILEISMIPHIEGRGDWEGADCWGRVELVYEKCLGIKLPNREFFSKGGSLSLYKAWHRCENFVKVEDVKDFDIQLMTSIINEKEFVGHCGIILGRNIFHSESGIGALFERLSSPPIKVRTYCVIRHVDLYRI